LKRCCISEYFKRAGKVYKDSDLLRMHFKGELMNVELKKELDRDFTLTMHVFRFGGFNNFFNFFG
jgi:hypothetical protein